MAVLRTINVPSENPVNDVGRDELTAFKADVRRIAKMFASLADFDPSLEVMQVKIADGLCRTLEKVRDNVEEAGKACLAQMKMLDRAASDTEFDFNEYERLERRYQGLRMQWLCSNHMFAALLDARADIVSAAGIEWPSYLTLKQMAGVNRTKRRMGESFAEASRLLGMTETEYRNRMKARLETEVRHDGINADDGQGSGRDNVAQFKRAQEERSRLSDKNTAVLREVAARLNSAATD